MAIEQKSSPWINLSALITERDLAERWHKSTRTLQRYRADGTGPVWLRIGGNVLYRLSDVLAFEEGSRREGAAE
jgi:hypothetical protein